MHQCRFDEFFDSLHQLNMQEQSEYRGYQNFAQTIPEARPLPLDPA